MKPKSKVNRPYFGNDVKKYSPKSHQHMVEMIKAKTTRPDLDRYIVRRIPNVGT